jgi:RNA polymerase sigma-70 factor (ECF subfamily)
MIYMESLTLIAHPRLLTQNQVLSRSSNEKSLVQSALRGEVYALDELLNLHRAKILNLAFQILHDENLAHDAAQESFVKAFQSLPSFQGKSSFGTWLYRVALNICLEKKRGIKSEESLDCVLEIAGTNHNFDQKIAVETVRDSISEPLRVALILREWHGLSYEEIAGATGVPVGTVRSRLNAARLEFRRLWLEMEAEAQ